MTRDLRSRTALTLAVALDLVLVGGCGTTPPATDAGSGGFQAAGGSTGGSASGTGGVVAASGGAASGGTTGSGGGGSGGAPSGGTTGVGGAADGSGGASASGGGAGSGGSASGGAGGGSSGGSGGLPTVPDNGCNVTYLDQPVGFAALDGGTVGGGDVEPTLVTTGEELESLLADDEPRVLYLMNDLDLRTEVETGVPVCLDDVTCDNGSGVQVDGARVSSTCDEPEHAGTSYRYESRLNVGSNKTLIGVGDGDGAEIRGAGFNIGSSEQVIFRNLRVYDINPHLVEAGDGITLAGARHIWLDHLLLGEISDGFVDIGSADHTSLDDFVTVSYVHFDGRSAFQCGGHHNFVNFVDNGHVTYHHNWFDSGGGRNPKVGGVNAQVHLFNNYWLDISYFCMTAQMDAEARVDSNYFEDASRPHWLQLDGSGTAGIAIDAGNTYVGTSNGNTNRDVGGSVFSVPYEFSKQTASEAKSAVVACSGPQPIH